MNLDQLKYYIEKDTGVIAKLTSLINTVTTSISSAISALQAGYSSGVTKPYITVSADFNLSLSDISGGVVLASKADGAQTISLPATVAGDAGKYMVTIVNVDDTGATTVDNGATSPVTVATLSADYEAVTLVCTGARSWAIVSGSTPGLIGAAVDAG